MKFPDDISELLKRKFKNKHREWLKTATADTWPMEINLGIPTEQDALRRPEAVRSWIFAWRSWHSSAGSGAVSNGALVWNDRRWRSLGTQSVPEKLIVQNPHDVAAWTGESARWLRAVNRFQLLVQRWPALIDTLPKHFNVLADYNDSDFLNLCEIVCWICAHPKSNLYIRQIPVAGIDSKWLESRKSLVTELVAIIQGDLSTDRDLFRCCGLRPQPQLIRMRILDTGLRNQFGGLGDISAPLEEAAGLSITPATVFIVENLQTALAFNDLENAIVLMGLGYGVDVLGKIPWLRNARCVYWGDIDTHGFAILNRARIYLPHLEAALMDESTLLNHRQMWVMEKDQSAPADLANLTDAERKLYQALKNNVFGQHVRLEQERIRWDEAWSVLPQFIL